MFLLITTAAVVSPSATPRSKRLPRQLSFPQGHILHQEAGASQLHISILYTVKLQAESPLLFTNRPPTISEFRCNLAMLSVYVTSASSNKTSCRWPCSRACKFLTAQVYCLESTSLTLNTVWGGCKSARSTFCASNRAILELLLPGIKSWRQGWNCKTGSKSLYPGRPWYEICHLVGTLLERRY